MHMDREKTAIFNRENESKVSVGKVNSQEVKGIESLTKREGR